MAHLTLIRPPAIASRFSYSIGIVPPLGPAYLAAALRAAGHRVAVIDALGEAPERQVDGGHGRLVGFGLGIDETVGRIAEGTNAVALSVMFSQQWPQVEDLIQAIARRSPGLPVFVGGEHVTGTWRYILDTCPAVTACAFGEGEETIVELAAHLDGERLLSEIPGIAFRDSAVAVRSAARARKRRVDDIARPAWDLFPLDTYFGRGYSYGVNRGRSMPILGTRGCPYQCTFCSSAQMWTTRYYMRDATDVVDEIADYVDRYGVENIDFYDLTAVIKRDWILAFCAELERRSLAITFQLPSGTRAEALDEEVLSALYRSGCRNICYAPESGSVVTLERIKKKLKPGLILDSVRVAKRVGINVKTNLMIGFPDETRRDMWQTLWYGARLAWSGVDDIPLFPVLPYPGTELYEALREQGVLPEPSREYFSQLGFSDLDQTVSLSQHISDRELGFVRAGGMALFYVIGYARRPWRILRTIRNLRTGESATVLEQRLREMLQRLGRGVLSRKPRELQGGLAAEGGGPGTRSGGVLSHRDGPQVLALSERIAKAAGAFASRGRRHRQDRRRR